MRRQTVLGLLSGLLALGAIFPSFAGAAFGVDEFDVTFAGPPAPGAKVGDTGPTLTQAGAHPYEMTTSLRFESTPTGEGGVKLDEAVKDVLVDQVKGFVGNPTAVPRCSTTDFLTSVTIETLPSPACPPASAVGVAKASLATKLVSTPFYGAIYNLQPSPGAAAKLGFWISGVPVSLELGVRETPPYNVTGGPTNISTVLAVADAELAIWGTPADPRHDALRGPCLGTISGGSLGSCEARIPEVPFLTLPRACQGPLRTTYMVASWQNPDLFVEGFSETHDEGGAPQGMTGCGRLGFEPEITAEPTSKAASSPSGLDFSLDTDNEGIANAEGITNADVEKAVVTLPEGFSVNPALAEGLEVCTEAQLEAESPFSAPGEGPAFTPPGAGCPGASKIGTVEVETPILEDQILHGSIFAAAPYENPFGSLLALYMVIKDPGLGIVVKVPLKVTPDSETGQLTTVGEDLPSFPFSHFALHFREGTRSPLATPAACGTYDGHDVAHEPVRALLYPSSGGAPLDTSSTFEIVSGPDGSPCPKGGLPPFHPELVAGTLNNAAGSFSPFSVQLTRSDSEQEITNFSIKLPPGVAGKLAGVETCSDAAIARAAARTGPHGGAEELADPSCPATSRVGSTLAGAGVGPSLAYAPGKLYLAGPYHGAPVSIVAITAGVVGPFDIGTVVVRLAVDVNPETGEVFLDSTGSDPIPHIIKGIPIHLRDVRANTDRPEFTFNPTDCTRTSTAATVLGSGLDFASTADDNPFVSTSPFQAADCAALPFEPKLTLRLQGGTKRGDYPRLKAFLRMNGFGEAGVARAQVTLPRSEFIANAHFQTICTRVQFKAAGGNGEACPAGSIYGWARAKTPVLADPLEGPVFLRSSEHELPDVVASLRGRQINVHLVGRVDSIKGRLRNTFETVPDAPVEWASFSFQGGRKGLFENSTNLCVGKHRADVRFTGQNGKRHNYRPAVKVSCAKERKRKKQRAATRLKRAAG